MSGQAQTVTTDPARPWKMDEAIALARELEPYAFEAGWHVALGGGVLLKGESAKDVDLIIYAHKSYDRRVPPAEFVAHWLPDTFIAEKAERLDLNIHHINDAKIVFAVPYAEGGRRVDLIFAQ